MTLMKNVSFIYNMHMYVLYLCICIYVFDPLLDENW